MSLVKYRIGSIVLRIILVQIFFAAVGPFSSYGLQCENRTPSDRVYYRQAVQAPLKYDLKSGDVVSVMYTVIPRDCSPNAKDQFVVLVPGGPLAEQYFQNSENTSMSFYLNTGTRVEHSIVMFTIQMRWRMILS